jgi:hypothetical protein
MNAALMEAMQVSCQAGGGRVAVAGSSMLYTATAAQAIVVSFFALGVCKHITAETTKQNMHSTVACTLVSGKQFCAI